LQSLDKLVKTIEDLGLREIESFPLGHISNFLLGSFVSFFVFSVEFDATSENFNYFRRISFPDIFNLGSWRNDFLSAVLNHLVGDFDEESSHFVRSVVETSNSVDHLDSIHERRKSLNDLLRGASV